MGRITDRLSHAWNAWNSQHKEESWTPYYGTATYGSQAPGRMSMSFINERSIVAAIYVRMAIDATAVGFRHIERDDQNRYLKDRDSSLNNCLTVEANIDQTAFDLFLDVFLSLFDKAVIAICPMTTTLDPNLTGGYDVQTMRVGEIINWYPEHVRVRVWRQEFGRHEEITLSKKIVAIVYNPLYGVMNAPNSTLQRLTRKLNQLDTIDEFTASGKLDMIIQLPYVVQNTDLEAKANNRRKTIEMQLKDSQYGIAYTDGTEKITQLNRPAENNILKQVEMLVTMLYGQLGVTEEVMNGTADEATMINYYNRTIEPLLTAVAQSMNRTFLTKTARSQKQAVDFFRNPFKLMPLSVLAEIADKLTRNEILSSNEFRGIMGYKPDADPKSDQLRNSNMPQSELGGEPGNVAGKFGDDPAEGEDAVMSSAFDEIDSALDETFADLGVEE